MPIEHRGACQLEVPEQIDQRSEALLAIGIEIEAGIIEETGTGP